MADAYARISGRLGVLSVHQGSGLTNAMTGITEAAKSRTPLLVLAAEATRGRSNFRIDQAGAGDRGRRRAERVRPAGRGRRRRPGGPAGGAERRTVLLNLPLDVQPLPVPDGARRAAPVRPTPAAAAGRRRRRGPGALLAARPAPVFLAGRGARSGPGRPLAALAERCGALLATSAVAKGLFAGNPWSLDVSGGFASPLAAELIGAADVVVGWGCALNMWTTRHGRLIGSGRTVVQVDLDPDAIGANRPVDLGLLGDVAATAAAAAAALDRAAGLPHGRGARRARGRRPLAGRVRMWTTGRRTRIDPRTLSIGLDDLLPAERVVAVDSGNFMGYPSMYLSVPDQPGSASPRRSSRSGSGWPPRSGPRSPGRTG